VPEIVRLEADGGGDGGEGGAGVGVGAGVDAVLLLPGTETPAHAVSVSRSNRIVPNGSYWRALLRRTRIAFTTSGEQ
jgi:hypothetical protein